jgi:hypothetical protein
MMALLLLLYMFVMSYQFIGGLSINTDDMSGLRRLRKWSW